ncbi:unnamed protein product [marine sediment metagenome]|uniref:Uncharacterized protein n=1 Tax=marine sediment metagenome TaxID=412755 RepID=X1RZX3_9ZZZZ
MAKRKYPSELNSRTIRVNIGDWQWLNSLSQHLGITVAQAFHKVITGLDHKDGAPLEQDHKALVKPAQIPLIVTSARSMPVITAHKVKAPVALPYRPQPIIATNGHSSVAFRIKPKGVRND